MNSDQVFEEQVRQCREEHAFFIDGMHPSERRTMCVRVVLKAPPGSKGISLDLAEVDDDDAPMSTENSVLQTFVWQYAYTVKQVLRCAFDPRECPKCGSRKHLLTEDGMCEEQWTCRLRAQRGAS